MANRRYPRERRREPRGRRRPDASPERQLVHHRLYGDIPILIEKTSGADGRVRVCWRFDPDYAPPLPRGAVRGDIRNQSYCLTCHIPKYFYVDEERTCVQCGEAFCFRAAEQKYWYETLKFLFVSVPVRCASCRRRRRSEHALREQIARARAQVRESGADPAAHLALARALVEYHQRTNQGDLDRAIAAARRAARLWPDAPEPHYWEGMAQARAGRSARAREVLAAFLANPALRDGALKQNASAVMRGL